MPRISAWLFALVALVLFGCGSSSSKPARQPTAVPTPPPAITIARGAPIAIGLSAALSGDQVNLGSDIADAAELAVADHGGSLRGHPLKVERMDDRCVDAEKAVAVAHSLAQETALVGVIGPMCTTGAQAADSVYEAAQIVHVLPAATRSDLSQQGERFFFRTAWRDEFQASIQAAYATGDLAVTSAVVIDDGGPYGKALADAFTTAFEAAGGRVLARERVERGTTDFSPVARKVKSANPPLVVFEGLNPEGTLTLKALHEAGYTGQFMAPDGVLSVRDFIVTGGPVTDGAILTGGASPDDVFATRFRDRFHRDAGTPFVLQSHDAVTALLAAVEAAAVEQADGALVIDRGKLAEQLRSQVFAGLTGPIQFDEHGDRKGETPAELGLRIYRVANGRFDMVR
jgi:branched-chain amino acid transport system substrate-binding protein